MFHPDTSLDRLAALGIDPAAVREVVEDERAIRCPERGAVYPEYGFASLTPDPALEPGLAEPPEPWDPASSLPPAGYTKGHCLEPIGPFSCTDRGDPFWL